MVRRTAWRSSPLKATLRPVPGLGRPFAYTPSLLAGGTVLFRDFVEREDKTVYRYRIWNPAKDNTLTLFTSTKPLFGLNAGPNGSVAMLLDNTATDAAIVTRDASGKQRTFPIGGDGSFMTWGRTYIAATLNAPDSQFGSKPTGLVLLDPATGKQTSVPGWQPIAWTPDGAKLLVRDTSDPLNSTLALLDPSQPDAARPIGTIPALSIYTGPWIRGEA